MANGKKKGNRGERQVVDFFKEWSGLEFSRVPQSGGLRWHRKDDTTGDVICTTKKKKCGLSIESKNYREINFQHLLLPGVQCDILKFWAQAKEDGIRGEKTPILLMRVNGMKKSTFFVVMDFVMFWLIKTRLEQRQKWPTEGVLLESGKLGIVMFHSDFLKTIPYGSFNKVVKGINKEMYEKA